MIRAFTVAAFAAAAIASSSMARADGFDGTYRGSLVCEKMAAAPDILRAPFDMIVSGKTATFARPVFDVRGTLVIGSELATGTVEDGGAIKLTSTWSIGGVSYQGSYSGAIAAHSGTMTGTQAWKTRAGDVMRGCTVAFVQRS
ncbi:MAG TPA: hypothetical protein VN655_02080 [Pseudolabrys sp.]|nr:hypothetical protein [Pseudolabrys sp.]